MSFKAVCLFSMTLAISTAACAWGLRGHHTICDAASFLVQEKGLRDYLQAKNSVMGYLCNVPDIYWRDIDTDRVGDATHYVDVELIPLPIKDIPTNFNSIITSYTGAPNPVKKDAKIVSIPKEFGSNWWRADQFYRRAIANAEAWKATAPPANSKEEQDTKLPFNQYAFSFMVDLGLMGHFVGDNGQPFHSTVDYDGYMTGHGGLHAYFEELLVAAQPPDLTMKVLQKARELQKKEKSLPFLNQPDVITRMRALAAEANGELKKIFEMDKVKKASMINTEKGMSIKTPAERESAEKMAPKFQNMLVLDMARSAALLAKIWDEAYVQVGRPKLAAHKSYSFPIQPEFVVPDYFDLKEVQKK
jgi:hypothetical protein